MFALGLFKFAKDALFQRDGKQGVLEVEGLLELRLGEIQQVVDGQVVRLQRGDDLGKRLAEPRERGKPRDGLLVGPVERGRGRGGKERGGERRKGWLRGVGLLWRMKIDVGEVK